MYAVKNYHTGQLRAWHQESKSGLQRAIEECEMRTHATNITHIVTDNNGLRLHLSLPHEVKRRLQEERRAKRSSDKWIVVVAFLLLMWTIFSPR